MNNLIDNLIKENWLKTANIIEAFKKIKREDFLPENEKNLAQLNEALPIGLGQTISQPSVVAFMMELLQPQAGDKILDIGSGSGWTTALLAECVGPKGKVFGIEIIPQLKDFGEENAGKYNFVKKGIAQFICAEGSKGFEKEAPFDKILCSAEAAELPEQWKKQLKIGGRIVLPINSSIWLFRKKTDSQFESEQHRGFAFVPLVIK